MKMKGKIRLLFAVMLCNVFLSGVCVSALRERLEPWEGSLEAAADGNSLPADGEKLLALTFDDGPHSRYTKKLLDGLRERKIKASFFLVGENIPGNEEVVRQMAEDGHFIGVHCYSHVDLTKKSAEESCKDILKTAELIENITGARPEYIRPPYGKWNDELEECVEMLPVFWDIDTRDWESQNSRKIVNHICKNAGKHHIILLHDVFETSVDAALAAVDTLTAEGYTFVTVDELLID